MIKRTNTKQENYKESTAVEELASNNNNNLFQEKKSNSNYKSKNNKFNSTSLVENELISITDSSTTKISGNLASNIDLLCGSTSFKTNSLIKSSKTFSTDFSNSIQHSNLLTDIYPSNTNIDNLELTSTNNNNCSNSTKMSTKLFKIPKSISSYNIKSNKSNTAKSSTNDNETSIPNANNSNIKRKIENNIKYNYI